MLADDFEMVKTASHKLAMEAPTLVGGNLLYAVCALALALAQAAVLSGESYKDVVELLALHYKQISVTEAVEEAKEAGLALTITRGPQGEPS
jgi:hypothetical protein